MRILVTNPYGIGDVLFSLPLVQHLRKTDPSGFLGYLSNARTAELVATWKELDAHDVFEKDEFRNRWKESKREGTGLLARSLQTIRTKRFDVMIDLSLGWHYAFAGLLAGIPKRIGFNFRGRGRFLTHAVSIPGFHIQPVAQYYLDLVPLLGWPRPEKPTLKLELPPNRTEQVAQFIHGLKLARDKRWIGIVPGGGASWGPHAIYKQWSPDRFGKIASELASRYDSEILLFGDEQERPLCETVISAMAPQRGTLVSTPSLILLAEMLKQCALLLGNDGGTMHLAEAVGTKTVSLFGPVDPSVYGPLDNGLRHRVVTLGLACQPCYQGFRFPPCPWDNACLKELQPSRILETVHELLKVPG